MSYTSTLTQKGQVTIPASIRKFLNIKPYEKVTFTTVGDHVIIQPAKDLLSLRGSVQRKKEERYSDDVADGSIKDYIKNNYKKDNEINR